MWTIRRNHRHINPETLSEYLDNRLRGRALARVDQQLASCSDCREELESLRSTVSLLQELPLEPAPRSFVMAAPPPLPQQSRSSASGAGTSGFWKPMRVPQWAYAGAASIAVIFLLVLVSVDATGLLSREAAPLQVQPAAAPVPGAGSLITTAGPTAVPEEDKMSLSAAVAPTQALAQASELEDAAAQPASPAATTAPAAVAAPAPTTTPAPAAVAAQAAPPTPALSEPAQAPLALPAEASGETGLTMAAAEVVEPLTTGTPTGPEMEFRLDQVPSQVQAEPLPESQQTTVPSEDPIRPSASPVLERAAATPGREAGETSAQDGEDLVVPMPEPTPTSGGAPIPDATPISALPEEGTALFWRILEILAGALGLVFLSALILNWRSSQRTARS